MVRALTSCLALLAIAVSSPVAFAAPPSETLLPNTTKGYLSIPDVDLLRTKFDETQIGQLAADPLMKPFADDLRKQIKEKLDKQGVALGLTWDDLEGVYGGEVCVAAIQPGGDKKAHAAVLLCDTTNHDKEAQELLAKVQKNLVAKGGQMARQAVGTVSLTIFTMPKKPGAAEAHQAVYAHVDNVLLACNHLATAQDIAWRMQGRKQEKLDGVVGFQQVMKRVNDASGDTVPHLRWWVEPFGYVEVARAEAGGRKQRGTDMLKVLHNQGFSAIQGLGGVVSFATKDHEILHRSFIYAPAASDAKAGEKYKLAARMLQFPNGEPQAVQDFVPRDVATYMTMNWKMQDAFNYVETLVDEVAGQKGIFREVLQSIKDDEGGPQVDIPNELIKFLGERASLTTDYQLPITPKSERFAVIVDATNSAKVAAAVDKALAKDPGVKVRQFKGQKIYEIVNEEAEAPELMIDGPGGPGEKEEEEEEEEETPMLPNSAVTVLQGKDGKGWLVVATHVDFIEKLLDRQTEGEVLAGAADVTLVNEALKNLKAGTEALRWFSRTDESVRPTYELIRQGQMPQAETMLGKLLNRLLGPDDKNAIRKQVIDGTKLPDFQVARRYLGPAGGYIKSEEDGWMITGCLLNKDGKRVEVAKQPDAAEAK